jgi:NAD(P)H-dependent flavin oxidoreductase YrpB (nitropropane dioxygenase family)
VGVALLDDLEVALPVLAAPMAGGPTTPGLVAAAADVGSLGFVAGGYQTAHGLAAQLTEVRATTTRYGVNLFAPRPVPVDRAAYHSYRSELLPLAERLGVELPDEPVEDDDSWRDKVDVLLDAGPPWVSFTFGLPEPSGAKALRRNGSVLLQTVTSPDEARLAVEAGADAVVAQASTAGGHWGTFTPSAPPVQQPLHALVAAVRAAVGVPVLAAGGVGNRDDVAAALRAGAVAVVVGTLLLLTPEAGTSTTYRAAVADPYRDRATALTRAFSGRPARGLVNGFMAAYDGRAPLGYPAVHHLTSPIRRAATVAGDPDLVNLWAGTGVAAVVPRPAGEILRSLA